MWALSTPLAHPILYTMASREENWRGNWAVYFRSFWCNLHNGGALLFQPKAFYNGYFCFFFRKKIDPGRGVGVGGWSIFLVATHSYIRKDYKYQISSKSAHWFQNPPFEGGGGQGVGVANGHFFSCNPFIYTQGWYIPNFITIGLLGEWSIFFSCNQGVLNTGLAVTQAISDVEATYIALFFTFMNKLHPNQCSLAPYHGYKRASQHIFAISEKSIWNLMKILTDKRKWKIRVFWNCSQNLKNIIFICQKTQNRPKISHFWTQDLQKKRESGSILSSVAYKDHVFQILKTVPEYPYFPLSFVC